MEVFNVSEYRRKLYGAVNDAELFDVDNEETVNMRLICNQKAIEDMEVFLKENENGVVIFDSINNTFDKRFFLLEKVGSPGVYVYVD